MHVRQDVEREAVAFGFDQETAFRIALAVDEACTNIIKHAYGGSADDSFDLEIYTGDSSFQVVLTDHGKRFSAASLPRLDMKRYFERMCRGGLGIHIMRLVMDDVKYDVSSNQCNRLCLVKRRPAANG
jgi:serine/threonine-protein kinase RsbW